MDWLRGSQRASHNSHFSVQGEITKVIPAAGGPKPGSFKFHGELNDFEVTILDSLTVKFTQFAFTSTDGAKPDVTVALDPGNPITFTGDLSFVDELRKAIPPGLFGDGPTVVTLVSLLVVVFLVVNLVVDLLYAVLDPRIRYA